MSTAARSSPLFHGRTSATASASPAARPRSSIAPMFSAACSTRSALHDVVDAALHDEGVGSVQDEVEAPGDLVRALAVDGGRPELEARVRASSPPLPRAPLVGRGDPRADDGVRIPERRAGGDRIAGDRDDDLGHVPYSVTCAARARRRARSRAPRRCAAACRSAGGRPPRSRRAIADWVVPQSSASSRCERPIAVRRSATRSAIRAKNQPRSPATIRSCSRSTGPLASARAFAAIAEMLCLDRDGNDAAAPGRRPVRARERPRRSRRRTAAARSLRPADSRRGA